MRPLHQWLAVKPTETIASKYLWVPEEVQRDAGQARVGTVVAVGEGIHDRRGRLRTLDVGVGDRVIYSNRVDSYLDETLDLIEEASVIGVWP